MSAQVDSRQKTTKTLVRILSDMPRELAMERLCVIWETGLMLYFFPKDCLYFVFSSDIDMIFLCVCLYYIA